MPANSLKKVPTQSGIYCLFDLDGAPAYGGRSSNLRSRLSQHFVRQDSSVVSYGRLDIWDISHVDWWVTEEDKIAEKDLIYHYAPYLNFSDYSSSPEGGPEINFNRPDGRIYLLSDEEREYRSQPFNRAQQKLKHIERMIDKIKYADHSKETQKTVYIHSAILGECLSDFLDIDQKMDLTDWISDNN